MGFGYQKPEEQWLWLPKTRGTVAFRMLYFLLCCQLQLNGGYPWFIQVLYCLLSGIVAQWWLSMGHTSPLLFAIRHCALCLTRSACFAYSLLWRRSAPGQ